MTEAGKPATAKELAERLEKARHIMMPGGEWFDTLEVEEVIKGLKALASQPEDKLKALKELREFVVEIAEACEDTVYAQQKWLVAERGLKMLVKKIDALLATEGTK